MLNVFFGKDIDDSLNAFLSVITFFILLFSVLITFSKDSISSLSVTFLNLGRGLLRLNSGISSSSSILSREYFFCSFLPNKISSIDLIYLFFPEIVRMVKIPPIMPLIPYLPQAFKLDFLPPFYFTYWIVILAIIAISHEFAHGIFAAYNKIKIKTTGFGFFPFFLPIFLAAFVELDEKKMAKHKKLEQMAILSAGTFANVICAGIFLLVLWGFFSLAFIPGGELFQKHGYYRCR